jgi:hypothetical protein
MLGRLFVVPAGGGAFLCEANLYVGHESQAKKVFHVRALTFLNRGHPIRPGR